MYMTTNYCMLAYYDRKINYAISFNLRLLIYKIIKYFYVSMLFALRCPEYTLFQLNQQSCVISQYPKISTTEIDS